MGKSLTQSETSGKSKETQNYQNNFDFLKAPDNPYFKNAESLIEGYDGGAGAAREAHGRNVNDINEAGNDFMGAQTPDYVRDKVKQSRLFNNNLALGRNLADAKQNEVGYKNSGYMSLGAATQPQLVQTGGSSTATGESDGTGYTPLLSSLGHGFTSGLGGATGSALGM